ncbi:hypothetical protein C4D60_Mb05t03920 [Musa balbisiana]|uniref:Uncharacterized protein n=1 Tax=Musa balbisiana TaxID=52838 RepID=A0A4S8JTH3_MUSBA|nr:hypothetical protein C4D60_Mb05t03920 [Musa balbisiana]
MSTVVPRVKKPTNRWQTTIKRRCRVVEERVETILLGWSWRMGLQSGWWCVEAAAHVVGPH